MLLAEGGEKHIFSVLERRAHLPVFFGGRTLTRFQCSMAAYLRWWGAGLDIILRAVEHMTVFMGQ